MKYQWIILALALAGGLIASLVVNQRDNANFEPDYPISLLETKDKAVDLYNANDPRIRVIYFGYTHCPDVCPTSLAVLSAALQQIEPEQLARLWPIFITLDPERDTAEKSAEYAQYFHPSIIGMTGTKKQTKALAEKYGVLYMKTELKGFCAGLRGRPQFVLLFPCPRRHFSEKSTAYTQPQYAG
ncbi:putative copper metallochaperone [Photobacterium aphoticum]|uniref:Putative copper metallochaperone n=1 Tax=Photobacterium aphoticum TaxID=754436 RepID=A0A090QJF7_9GAMM|nr:putative copper metallochaperone [Photobacterium aphoticum]